MVKRKISVGDYVQLNKKAYPDYYNKYVYKVMRLADTIDGINWFAVMPIKFMWLYITNDRTAIIIPESELINLGSDKEKPIIAILFENE